MKRNNLITNMKQNKLSYGCQFNSPSSEQIELLGMANFDFILFDGEHGTFTPDSLEDQARISEMANLTPFAMVPNIERSTIHSFLERGVLGIHGPNINTKEDAEKLSQACKYSPLGNRSLSLSRATHFGLGPSRKEFMEHTNSQIIVIALLEHKDVLKELDQIIQVPGIDFYAIGPKDFAQSIGRPGEIDHPEVKNFEKAVMKSVNENGKKMSGDVYKVIKSSELFYCAAKSFIE
ncbi:MAG: hypothetical protein FI687_06825 [SAR202 cluster bacterium]|nr:hypothetical protein [SAR202 cluster bacterium]|tara:strand:+ start:15755 stop:16459 length:705 start_codon:yes stop_codon:yes gene_type:complete